MRPEVREFIKHAGLCRSTVEQMATMLPDDDLELDAWIGEAIRENDSMAFHLIIFAALIRDRPVDARHLSTGTKLAGGALYLAAIAFRVQGEMPEYLLEGLHTTAMYHAAQAMAFLTLAVWCDERRNGVYPDQLIPEARRLARHVKNVLEVDAYLIEVALRTKDSVLHGLIRDHYPKGSDAGWEKALSEGHNVAEREIGRARGSISGFLPEH